MNNNLHYGKVAIITGANSGLGLAIAKELVEKGAKVTLVARNKEKLNKAIDSIKIDFPNAEAIAISADISTQDGTDKYVDETLKAFGTIDYLINNAASDGQMVHLVDYDMDVFRQVIETNLIAVANGIKSVAPTMIAKGKGSIVSIASNSGIAGVENLSAYSASKHGLIGLTKNAAIELGPKGIRVNATAPGGIKTEMLQEYLESTGKTKGTSAKEIEIGMTANNPLLRFSLPSEQANVVLFLLSDLASYINGETIVVDGGQTAKLSS